MNILDIAIAKKLAGGGGGSGTDNYNDLSNLPKINDTTLSGNKSSSALGLQSEINSDSKLASDLVDDTNQDNKFVTSTEKNTWNAKQNAIDADHKINADYVDDSTSTNKFVTASDKETWNAKQNAIDNSHKLSSDLVDDANHTNKFVTSTEKQTWNAKQNAIDSDHKLSSSLVSFTTAEAAALASGIDSTKVAQISTNQSNILYVADQIGKNQLDISLDTLKAVNTSGTWNGNVYTLSVGTVTVNADGSITVKKTSTASRIVFYLSDRNADMAISGTKFASYILSGCPPTGSNDTYRLNGEQTTSPWVSVAIEYGNGYTINTSSIPVYFYISLNAAYTTPSEGLTFKPMICTAEAWSISHEFEPYALPNYDLTRLEAEDRASLAEVVDSGAKNLLQNVRTSTTIKGVTFTVNSDGSVSTYGTSNAADAVFYINQSFKFQSGVKYVLSGCPSGGSADGYRICSMGATYVNEYGDGAECVGDGVTREIAIYVKTSGTNMGTAQSPKIFKPMVCTKAAFGVSPKFVPFGNDPSYQVSINHNMIYRGRNLGASLTDAQHTALSSGNFTDLYLGDYWTKTVTIPAGTYTGGDGEEVTVPAQTNITLKAVIADFDTFYAGYASTYAGINTHHAAVIVTGFSNVVWNKTNSTAGGYVASLIHKWLVGSALPQIETWFGSAKVLSHQKLLTNAITGDAASGWAWSSQKISLLSENQMYGSKVWGNSKAANGGYEPGEAFKHLNVFNHIDANLLFGDRVIWLRDIASAGRVADLFDYGYAYYNDASNTWIAPAALILLS